MTETVQAPPQQPPSPPLSPADRLLAAEGGPITPGAFVAEPIDYSKVTPLPDQNRAGAPQEAAASPPPHVIDLTAKMGNPTPPPPGTPEAQSKTADQIAFEERLSNHVNFEVNILNVCYGAVHNFVSMRSAMEPVDSADLGNSMFGPGNRTPIEHAVPQIAIEVYKEVRHALREDDKRREIAVSAASFPKPIAVPEGVIRRAIRKVFGR